MTDQPHPSQGVYVSGNQQAGNITNVAGNMTVEGGQTVVTSFGSADALREVARLRDGIEGLGLPAKVRKAAHSALRDVEAELRRPAPDRPKIAARLQHLAHALSTAGALATAGMAVVQPLQQLAAWLGPLGASLLPLLA